MEIPLLIIKILPATDSITANSLSRFLFPAKELKGPVIITTFTLDHPDRTHAVRAFKIFYIFFFQSTMPLYLGAKSPRTYAVERSSALLPNLKILGQLRKSCLIINPAGTAINLICFIIISAIF